MSSSLEVVQLPPPVVVAPTHFQGNDGNWSTFGFEIGTPPQLFNLLPATVGQEVWVPSTLGCGGYLQNLTDCGPLRGAGNASSTGFSYGNSSSFRYLGTYGLSTEVNLYGSQGAVYGLDTLAIQQGSNFNPSLPGQIVATYPTTDFWLGQFGLGSLNGSFNGSIYPSSLLYMKKQNITPSMSFGYTAGKYYDNQTPGSLVLGGYDAARMTPSNSISLAIPRTSPITLKINVTDITLSATQQSNNIQKISTGTLTMNIDSSTSEIWLPQSICDQLATAYGLGYDNATGLYFSNSTNRAQLAANGAKLYFTIASGGQPAVISIPWNAFDLTYRPYQPTLNVNIPYFPFRRANNDSQLTLGRAFLQEAYIIVDWERMNLNVSAAPTTSSTNILTILPNGTSTTTTTSGNSPNTTPSTGSGKSGGSSAGAIAGGVVGGIAALAIILGIFLWMRRRRRNQQQPQDAEKPISEPSPVPAEYYRDEVAKSPPPPGPDEQQVNEWYPPEKTQHEEEKAGGAYVNEQYHEMHSPEVGPAELASNQVHELPGTVHNRAELMSTPLQEMPGSEVGSELGVGASRSVRSPGFRSIDSPSPDFFGTPSPEHFMSPIGSSSSVQLGPSSSVHHFSSSHQQIVPSSEIVSSFAERDRLGGATSEIVVNSSPNEVASPLPLRENASTLASQPAEDLIHAHERRAD